MRLEYKPVEWQLKLGLKTGSFWDNPPPACTRFDAEHVNLEFSDGLAALFLSQGRLGREHFSSLMGSFNPSRTALFNPMIEGFLAGDEPDISSITEEEKSMRWAGIEELFPVLPQEDVEALRSRIIAEREKWIEKDRRLNEEAAFGAKIREAIRTGIVPEDLQGWWNANGRQVDAIRHEMRIAEIEDHWEHE